MRPLNPDQKENLRDQIDKWLEKGGIEPSVSPWALPLVPVKKKDGMRTDEMGHRSRELNKQTVRQLPVDEYSRNLTQSARSYCVRVPGCLWSLSCSENRTGQLSMYSIY